MAAVADNEARDRIAKLYTEHRELAADYWGPDKNNGKRSAIADLCIRIGGLESKAKHFEDTREASCLGLSAFRAYLRTKGEEETEMMIEKAKGKTLIQIQWVQLLGIILVALIALLK